VSQEESEQNEVDGMKKGAKCSVPYLTLLHKVSINCCTICRVLASPLTYLRVVAHSVTGLLPEKRD